MKNLLILLFGAALGAGGTILWLRKDIQKQLEEIKKQENESKNEKRDDDMPFQVEEKPKKEEKVAYHNIPMSDPKPAEEENIDEIEDDDIDISGNDETDGGILEIDVDEMMHNHEYEKERLVYYRGDRVMSTESGTIITNPFPLIGGEWENCVGNYADSTAFVRNMRLLTDYEIYVEDGLYSDEYGADEI